MRNIYSFISTAIILFGSDIDCKAQAYVPFPDSGAVWNVDNSSTDGTYAYMYWESLYFPGNSITAFGNTYKELYVSGNETVTLLPIGPTNYYWYNQSSGYALRQNVAQRKVYAYDITWQQEVIFIDFNFQVGDTLTPSNIIWGNGYFHVTSIDSVLIGSSYRKRYNFQPINGGMVLNNDTSIIEGIGSTSGLFWEPLTFEHGGNLNCFSLFNNQLYPVFSTTPCGINAVNESVYDDDVKTYADLFNQVLNIEISHPGKSFEYFISDITGKKIISGKLTSQKSSISIQSFSEGVYFIHIRNQEKNLMRKFIKI